MEAIEGTSALIPQQTISNATDAAANSNVSTTKSVSTAEVSQVIEAPTGETVEMKVKNTHAKMAAIGIEESPDGVIIKGAAAELEKREFEIKINGEVVVSAELYFVYKRAFEAHINKQHKAIGPSGEEEKSPYQPSGFETTVYKCCQAYTCDCKSCRKCRRDSVKKGYVEPTSLKKARPVGIDLIKETFMSFLNTSLVGEAFLYFTLLLTTVEFILSLVSLITNFKPDQADKVLEILSFVLSILGTSFAFLDFGLHFRHRGCRIFKRACHRQELEQEHDEEHKEFCNETCVSKSDENSCGKRCVAFLDVTRIFILETIYYPDLLSTMFEFIDELIQSGHNPRAIPAISWLSFIWNMLLIIVTVYLAKIHTLWGLVYSVRKARAEKKFQGILFILTFALYMLGILILQVLMISVIGGRYHHDHTAGEGKISGQLWYMMVSGYLTPLFGMIIFFVVHHFWTMKLPLDLIYDFVKVLQTEGIEGDNTKRGEEDLATVQQMLDYVDEKQFKADYNDLQKINCETKIGHPFSSPLHIILASFYSAMLFIFCLCSLIGGPLNGAWLLFYFLAGLFGTILNIYALSVFFVTLFFISSILIGIVVVIAVVLLCLVCAIFGSAASSNDRK